MGAHTILTRLFAREKTNVVVECRHCGTTVTPGVEECPECENESFSRYDIPQ